MISIKDLLEKEFGPQVKKKAYKKNPSDYLTEYFDSMADKAGLYVLNLPTGSGKTHNIFRFINTKGREQYPFCIYVVPQRKQRENAYDEYRNAIKKYGIDEDEWLILYSAVEQAERSYVQKVHEQIRGQLEALENRISDNEVKGNIQDALKTMDELMMALQYRIEFPMLKKIENGIAGDKAVTRLDTSLRISLRKILVAVLGDKRYDTPRSMAELKENVDLCEKVLPAIAKLYPWLRLYSCKTVLCTAAKFLSSLPMLINPDVLLYNSDLTMGAFVVLDESDGVYQDWRNQLLTNPSARTIYGLYNTFNKVCNSLASAQGKIPYKHECAEELENLITEVLQRRKCLLDAVGMQENLAIYTTKQPEKQRFCVFHADENRHLLTTRGKEMVVNLVEEENLHMLDMLERTDENKEEQDENSCSVYSIAREMVNILQFIATRLSYIVYLYMDRTGKKGANNDEKKNVVLFDKTVSNIFHKVNLDKMDSNIIESIKRMGNLYSYNNHLDFFDDDYSHYERGWMMVFLQFIDSDAIEDMSRTEINYLAHNVTSEKIVHYMVQNRKMTVALMSATASSASLSTNFNLEYLSMVLEKSMMQIPEQVLKDYEESMKQYLPDLQVRPVVCTQLPEVAFEPGKLDGSEHIPLGAENLFPERMRKTGMKFLLQLVHMLGGAAQNKDGSTVEYYMEQYYKFFAAYKNFMEDKKLYSALCLSERLPKDSILDGGMRWHKAVLSQGAALIDGRIATPADYCFMRLPAKFEDTLVYISSSDYDKEVEGLLKEWEAGKKRMAVSSYKTVGAGMNLAYRVPERLPVTGERLPYMKDMPDDKIKKDIDCIVLMDITGHRAFNRFSGKSSDEDKLEVYQYITFLLAMQFNGKLPYSLVRSEISQVIAFGNSILKEKLYGLDEDLKQFQLYKIIQSMGRISRSTIKGQKTLVLYEKKLLDSVASAPEDLAYTFEMRCFQQHAKNIVMADGGVKFREHQERLKEHYVLNRCNSGRSKIKSRISGALAFYNTHDKEVSDYTRRIQDHVEKIKAFICRYPTLNEDDMTGMAACLLWNYIEQGSDGPYYSVAFKTGEDMVVEKISMKRVPEYADVNEDKAYLPLLVQNKYVRDWFVQEGIALTWTRGKYILAPYQAMSTYKGCIGEQAFAGVMKFFFKISLEKLTGVLYEVGDWVDYSRGLVFDVKNYDPQRQSFITEKDLLPNYKHKLLKSGMRLVVINMLCNHDNPYIQDDVLDGKVIFINGLINSNTGQLIPSVVQYLVQLFNTENKDEEKNA